MKRRLGWVSVAAVLLAAVLQLLLSAPAAAHSVLIGSNPSDGEILATAPTSLHLQFSEAVDPRATVITLADGAGHIYQPGSITLAGETEVVASLPKLPPQTYLLDWRTVAADDRHVTSGHVVFAVGVDRPLAVSVPADPRPSAIEATLGWLVFAGIAAAVGGLAAHRGVAVPWPASLARVMRRLAVAGSALAVFAAVVVLVRQADSGLSVSLLTGTAFGRRSLARLAGLLLLLVVCLMRRTGRADISSGRRVTLRGVLATFAVLDCCVSTALLGHAASSPARLSLESLHLALAEVWLAGLLAAACTLPLWARRSGTGWAHDELRRAVTSALVCFGRPAAISVAGLVVTGVLLSGDSLSTVDSIVTSIFGRVLLVKLALALAAGLLGWASHRRLRGVRPGVSPRRLAVEALLLLGAVAGGATLAAAAPAQGLRFQPLQVAAGSQTVAIQAGDLVESLVISPNVVGRNFVTVGVFDTRRPAPAPIEGVQVSLTSPRPGVAAITGTAQRSGSAGWVLPVPEIDTAGTWQVGVTVHRRGMPDTVSATPWSVAGRTSGTATRLISQARVAPFAGLVAVALCVGLALAWAWSVLGSRPARGVTSTGASHPLPESDALEPVTTASVRTTLDRELSSVGDSPWPPTQ